MIRAFLALLALIGPAAAQTKSNFVASTGQGISSSAVDAFNGTKRDGRLLPTPQDFAIGSPAIDTGVNDAISAIVAASASGAATLPCGTYRLASTLTVTHSLIGAGRDCVKLISTVTTGDMIFIGPTVRDVTLQGMTLFNVGAQTTGAGIHSQGQHVMLRDISTSGNTGSFHDVILLDGNANTTTIADSWLDGNTGTTGACIRITGSAAAAQTPIDTAMLNLTLLRCQDNLFVEHGSGLYIGGVNSLGAHASGFRFGPTAGNYVYGVQMRGVLGDSSTTNGIRFDCGAADPAASGGAGCGTITEIQVSDVWASGSGTPGVFEGGSTTVNAAGIYVDNPKMDGLTIVGGVVRANGGRGIDLRSGKSITLSGVNVFHNNFTNQANACGIWFDVGVRNLVVTGSRSGAGGIDATPLQGSRPIQQSYGICRPTPAGGTAAVKAVITGNVFDGNITAGAQIGTISGDQIIGAGQNIGY